MRRPGIEPGTTAWKAAMLSITPIGAVEMDGRFTSLYPTTLTHDA